MKPYRYVHSCVESTYEDMRAMLDNAKDITRSTFVRHVDDQDREELEHGMGYDDLPITKDWSVSYGKGVYRGVPAYWMQWSRIEYIFTLHGEIGPSLAAGAKSTSLLARSQRNRRS